MPMRATFSLFLAVVLVSAGSAAADDVPAAPGPQAKPPSPQAPKTHEPLPTNHARRRSVRACTVDEDCHSAEELMLEFERETFPKPGSGSPWIDGDDTMGHEDNGTSHAHADDDDPLKLRPDLKWLADVELPDLPVHWDHRIIKYLEFYKDDPRGRRIMGAWIRDQTRFRDMILERLRDAKLPESLLYIAMIESSYNVWDYSRVGASGLWQFMPGTARIYGLRVDRWVDERNDPLRSTEAAVMMFADLHQRYGDWDLAFAAYHAGYGNVTRAIAKYNTNDFWQLLEYEAGLPWGSRIYVPKALAAAIVGNNRELFGYDEIKPADKYAFETVTLPRSASFAVIARATGTNTNIIAQLNPHLRRKRTPPDARNYVVRVPIGRAERFAERYPQLRGDWDGYEAYVAKHGERFEDIATVHGLTRKQLAELNGVADEAEIGGGTILVVPVVSGAQKRTNKKVADADLYRSSVPAGDDDDPLIVAIPDKRFRVDGKTRWWYRVVSGDSQWSIAKVWGVDRKQLAAWNNLDGAAHLHARMVLQVWTDKTFSPTNAGIAVLDQTRMHVVEAGSLEHVELSEGRLGRRRTTYTVKHGGTFEDVGKKYGLSKYDLARINRKPPGTKLEKGDEVIVYEVVDRTKSRKAARQAKKLGKRTRTRKRRNK